MSPEQAFHSLPWVSDQARRARPRRPYGAGHPRASRGGVARHRPTAGRSWRPAFTRLWGSAAASNLAEGVLAAGLPVLATQVTDSPGLIAAVAFAIMLPMTLLALPAGVIADRHDRRRVLVAVNLARAIAIAVATAAVVVGDLHLAAIYAAAAVVGGSEVVTDTTAASALPSVVERDQLGSANARLGGTQMVMNNAVGPAIGGFLAGVGAGVVLGIPAMLFAVAALVLRRISLTRPVTPSTTGAFASDATRPASSPAADLRAGIAYVRSQPVLRRIAAAAAVSNLGNAAFFAVFVLFVTGPLGLPATAYGAFIAAVAVGGLVGSLVAGRVLRRFGHVRALQSAAGVVIGAYLVVTVSRSPAVTASSLAVIGAGSMVWNVATRALRQTIVADRLLGRATATMMMVALVATPIGVVLAGIIAEVVGVRAVGVLAVAASVLTLAVILPIPRTTSPAT